VNQVKNANIPMLIHDLQDSQLFVLAQAAGRAGIPVSGSCWPMEGWAEKSVYVQQCIEMRCLSEVISGTYAREWKRSGLEGVWLPCVDDMAKFTSRYKKFLNSIGMRFLIPSVESMEKAIDLTQLSDVSSLKIASMQVLDAHDLLMNMANQAFPLMIKNKRNEFQVFDHIASLRKYVLAGEQDAIYRVQAYIEGPIRSMASVIVLFDEDSRAVRGFTGRRLKVEQTEFGPFGETLAAEAVWIPELYKGACALLKNLQWQGFAEVECKQAYNGDWYVMEINPRVSGWTCLAEADGAGLLQAYYQLCANNVRLEEACLQRSKADYVRMLATCYHDPEWDAPEYSGVWKKLKRLMVLLLEYRHRSPWRLVGAWDSHDCKASLLIAWQSLYLVYKVARIKRKSDA